MQLAAWVHQHGNTRGSLAKAIAAGICAVRTPPSPPPSPVATLVSAGQSNRCLKGWRWCLPEQGHTVESVHSRYRLHVSKNKPLLDKVAKTTAKPSPKRAKASPQRTSAGKAPPQRVSARKMAPAALETAAPPPRSSQRRSMRSDRYFLSAASAVRLCPAQLTGVCGRVRILPQPSGPADDTGIHILHRLAGYPLFDMAFIRI